MSVSGFVRPLPALGFLSPWLLLGLIAAGLPLLIHLWQRRRHTETPWAAMQFLLSATRRRSRRIRLEQLMLLVVRTLIVILVVTALARPYVEGLQPVLQADVSTRRIIAIDASYSMQFEDGGFSRFDRAREAARRIAAQSQQGDSLNLVRISSTAPMTIIRQPVHRAQSVVEELDELEASSERGDVRAALREVAQLLKDAPDDSHQEIYLLSDFQKDNWTPRSAIVRTEIRRLLKTLSEQADLVLIDSAQDASPNSAIVSFGTDASMISPGREVLFSAVVRNFGDIPLRDQVLEFHVDGRLVDTQRVDLAPRTDTPVLLSRTFQSGGLHQLEARLQDDLLLVDNRRFTTVSARDELNVLLVNGRPSGRATERATHFLQLALAPETSETPWRGLIQPHVIDEGELPGTDLARYDCVFLCNVALFTPRETDLLQTYARNGGRVIFCLGDQVQPDNYNQLLFDRAERLIPARLGKTVGDAKLRRESYAFDPGDFEHPLLEEFKGNPESGLESAMIFEYFQTRVPEESSANVALAFDSRDPAIVEAPYGAGRTILVTTSVDDRWGTWAILAQSFVPIVNELTLYSISGQHRKQDDTVGQTLSRTIPSSAYDVTAALTTPDGSRHDLALVRIGESFELSYESTHLPGIYSLSLGAPINQTELFSINVDPRESDLDRLTAESMSSDLLSGAKFAYRTQVHDQRAPTARAEADRGALSRSALTAALVLLFVEQAMAWRFTYGLALLALSIVLVLSRQVSDAGPVLVVLLVGVAGGIGWLVHQKRKAATGKSGLPSRGLRAK
ncbi:MAG: hypothetical protein CMJ48_00655 [Planctomycetaceae bacterium]|nr:hypothetical protein [Planctomycetaceae bacterium]